MTRRIIAAAAVAGALATLIAFPGLIGEKIGWPPYASARDIVALREELAATSQSILWINLENAIRSGDRDAIRRACNALLRETGHLPAGCS